MVKLETIGSGNSCGGRFWSDGKDECPMLPERLLVMVHPIDGGTFWLDDCREVGREYAHEPLRRYIRIPHAEEPDLNDYRRMLSPKWRTEPMQLPPWLTRFWRRPPVIGRKGPKINRRRYLLTRFWLKANDPIRHNHPKAYLPDDFREKLFELERMLDLSDDDDRITAAEIARECGNFEQAIELLDVRVSDHLANYQRKIRSWSEAADPFVHEIFAVRSNAGASSPR